MHSAVMRGSGIVDAVSPMLKSQLDCKVDRTWLRSDADVSQKIMSGNAC
jgi:hypothetical protein